MPDLTELYQSIILDHNRRPRNFGELAGADRRAEGRNPLCGDHVTVWLRLDGERIADVRFSGSGCAISKASASLMTTTVKGKTVPEAEALFERVHDLVTGHGPGVADDPELRSLAALGGVSRFPIRVKCASLAWHALRAALHQPGSEAPAVTTE
jgi:nitrogen fixation protein NifU and related proteins